MLTPRAAERIAHNRERLGRVGPPELPVNGPCVEVDPIDRIGVTGRHDELVVSGARPVEVEVDGVGMDRAEVVVARGRRELEADRDGGFVERDVASGVPLANQRAGRCDLLDDSAQHEVRRHGRVCPRRVLPPTGLVLRRGQCGRHGGEHRREQEVAVGQLDEVVMVGHDADCLDEIDERAVEAEVFVAVVRIGSEPRSERLEPCERPVGETLEVAGRASRRRACTRRGRPPSRGSSRTARSSARRCWRGGTSQAAASPSPDVVMCGKSGGTHRIQYSSAAPPPVGVIVMTIASSASIVTAVSSTNRSADPAHRHGRAGHAAYMHRRCGWPSLTRAVGDVVVLVGTERREHSRTA